MIGYLSGQVIGDDTVLTASGVGYVVSSPHALVVGSTAELWVHTVVREDSFSLYGFPTAAERDLFAVLVRASGVGPKIGLAMIATLGPARLVAALGRGDAAALATTPGIGVKKAATILTGITVPPVLAAQFTDETATEPAAAPAASADDELVSALVSMGVDVLAARPAVERVRAEHPAASESALLRQALLTARG